MMDHLNTDFLIDYLHGQLPPEDDALAHAHLETCPSCRAEYDAEAALSEILRSAAKAEELEFSSLISARVWEQVSNARPGWAATLASFFRPAVAVPAAAIAVVALVFAAPAIHGGSAQQVPVTYYLEAHAAQQAENPLGERSPTAAQLIETSAFDIGNGGPDLADEADAPPLATAFDAPL